MKPEVVIDSSRLRSRNAKGRCQNVSRNRLLLIFFSTLYVTWLSAIYIPQNTPTYMCHSQSTVTNKWQWHALLLWHTFSSYIHVIQCWSYLLTFDLQMSSGILTVTEAANLVELQGCNLWCNNIKLKDQEKQYHVKWIHWIKLFLYTPKNITGISVCNNDSTWTSPPPPCFTQPYIKI